MYPTTKEKNQLKKIGFIQRGNIWFTYNNELVILAVSERHGIIWRFGRYDTDCPLGDYTIIAQNETLQEIINFIEKYLIKKEA
jgi:hypothetical protein